MFVPLNFVFAFRVGAVVVLGLVGWIKIILTGELEFCLIIFRTLAYAD
jgi:hypothetical protein